jgi:zinc/manganese transport system ATP-binding protein
VTGRPGRVLAVEGVHVWLSGREVLHDVSFEVRAGEFTGLIGPNGAGKTTILRVVLGLEPPALGRVVLGDGERAGGRHPGARVGYVPQKVVVDPDMPLRARDLVSLGIDGHRLGIPRHARERRRRVDAMLEAVDARRLADARIGTLSGGELQRVLIAHSLVSEPDLLLLDEPLANLDLRSEHEVVALLARVASERQVAVLVSAHDMNPLLEVMDRIVYVAGGRAASGRTEEVVRQDVLSRLYGHEVDVLHVRGRILVVAGPHGPAEVPDPHRSASQAQPGRK